MKEFVVIHRVEKARPRAALLPAARIVESACGSLGLRPALAGWVCGDPVTVVADTAMEPSIRRMLAACAADVVLVDAPDPVDGWRQARKSRVSQSFATDPGAWNADQYNNCCTVAGRRLRVFELRVQQGEIDVVVCAAGTGRDPSGVLRLLPHQSEQAPKCTSVLHDWRISLDNPPFLLLCRGDDRFVCIDLPGRPRPASAGFGTDTAVPNVVRRSDIRYLRCSGRRRRVADHPLVLRQVRLRAELDCRSSHTCCVVRAADGPARQSGFSDVSCLRSTCSLRSAACARFRRGDPTRNAHRSYFWRQPFSDNTLQVLQLHARNLALDRQFRDEGDFRRGTTLEPYRNTAGQQRFLWALLRYLRSIAFVRPAVIKPASPEPQQSLPCGGGSQHRRKKMTQFISGSEMECPTKQL